MENLNQQDLNRQIDMVSQKTPFFDLVLNFDETNGKLDVEFLPKGSKQDANKWQEFLYSTESCGVYPDIDTQASITDIGESFRVDKDGVCVIASFFSLDLLKRFLTRNKAAILSKISQALEGATRGDILSYIYEFRRNLGLQADAVICFQDKRAVKIEIFEKRRAVLSNDFSFGPKPEAFLSLN